MHMLFHHLAALPNPRVFEQANSNNSVHRHIRSSEPKWLQWTFLGVDLLHAGPMELEKKFGIAGRKNLGSFVQMRWQNPTIGVMLECRVDRESESIIWIREFRSDPIRGVPIATISGVMNGTGISLGAQQNTALKVLGQPTSVIKSAGDKTDFLYFRSMSKNGLEPTFRVRYVFHHGILTQVAVSIGDN